MSGICGIINFDGAPVEPEVLDRMAQAAAHRGPDGINTWRSDNVGLAHLALNITPESLRERQPLVSRDGNLVLVADARIDNRDELIRTLTTRGHLAEPEPTDADLILAAYRCWGTACAAHIIGDFAFAIWDAAEQHLFAARDPMAMRAFYYRIEPRRLIFATEVKQILAAPGVPARLCEPILGAFLVNYGGPFELSFYEGIQQLPTAHALLANANNCLIRRCWDIDPNFRIRYRHEIDYIEHFRELFKEAVRCRLRSVAPIGIFLSGGMDSGSVASTAGWLLQHNGQSDYPSFRAYSFAFETLTQCDERHISNSITDHYEIPVTSIPAEQAWPLKDYPAHGPDRDEPFTGGYQPLVNLTLTTARADGVRPMFSGGFGDPVVGGNTYDYLDRLYTLKWWSLWRDLKAHSQWAGVPFTRILKRYLIRPSIKNTPGLLWPTGQAEWLRQPLRRVLRRPESKPAPYPQWIRPQFAKRVNLSEIIQQSDPPTNIRGFARQTRYRWFVNSFEVRIKTWAERNYAHFGLVHTAPWSDRRLLSFVMAVPPRIISRAGQYKRLAYQTMYGIMPNKARQTAGKIYPAPLYEQAIKEKVQSTVFDLITHCRVDQLGYIDERLLQDHYNAILNGAEEHHSFYSALSAERWLRQYWS